ncbi:MAG: hypothetical protein CVU26_06760 [Betaproteobacteria bacterium HGW-Betaproteobacteria-2]|nr:MAG: hypothetical protein CVU26_06760 [Betaproteobacteria bacterium HGW-Betaproteobacteria-2]
MVKTLNLTDQQKRRLGHLEPALKTAVFAADYNKAKEIAADIQIILRQTGHETRLMQSKNWLFEAALNAGETLTAERGFRGVIEKTSSRTKVHIEATALLAVSLLRQNKLKDAEPLICKVIKSNCIKNDVRREKFIKSIAKRFEMEGFIAAIRNLDNAFLDVDQVDQEAIEAIRHNKSEEELFAEIGRALPKQVVDYVYKIDQISRKQLTLAEVLYLPPPSYFEKKSDQGRGFFDSLKLVIWKSLCDPNSEIYKAWYSNGMSQVLTKKYYAIAVSSALIDLGFGVKTIAVAVTALLIKFGLEVYCEKYKPGELLDGSFRI